RHTRSTRDWSSDVCSSDLLILIHELGHFIVARLCGVGVERFSIGFGPVLLRWRGKETEYCLSAVPMGGYVKMMGEENPLEGGGEIGRASWREKEGVGRGVG